jgi:hypothetical protein
MIFPLPLLVLSFSLKNILDSWGVAAKKYSFEFVNVLFNSGFKGKIEDS